MKTLRSNISVLKEIPKDVSWTIWSDKKEGGKRFKSVVDYYGPEYGEADTPTELIENIVKSIEGSQSVEIHEVSDWVHIKTSDALTEIINLYLSTNDEFQVGGDRIGYTLVTPNYHGLFTSLADVFGALLTLPDKSSDMLEAENEYFKHYGSAYIDDESDVEDDPFSLSDLFENNHIYGVEDDEHGLVEDIEIDTEEDDLWMDDENLESLIEALEELEIEKETEEAHTEIRIQGGFDGNIVASNPIDTTLSLTEDLIKPKAKQVNDSDRLSTITDSGYTVSIDLNKGKVVAYFEKEDSERIGVCGRTLTEALDMFYTMTGRVI